MIRSYSELVQYQTLHDRFRYLMLDASVGDPTFGGERWLNQEFYRSAEWKRVRNHVIARDLGCDLGVAGHDIHYKVFIHHMNPMTPEDVRYRDASIVDPEYLITTSHRTHNAIHYGNEKGIFQPLVERSPGDDIPWRTR